MASGGPESHRGMHNMDEYCIGLHAGVDRAPLCLGRFDPVQFTAIQTGTWAFKCIHISRLGRYDGMTVYQSI